jgi:hypothetical protein
MSFLARLRQKFGQAAGSAAAPGGIVLQIDGQPAGFASPAEFETALRSRTEVVAGTMRQMAKCTDEELRGEVALTKALHKKLTTSLLRIEEIGVPLSQIWREIDLGKIHEEHQWQEILYGLADLGLPDQYRRVALVRYLQYLKGRRDAVADLLRERDSGKTQMGSVVASQMETMAGTAIDEITYTSMQRSAEYSRLPPRHAVEVRITSAEPVTIFLAHRKMRLLATEEGMVLSDDTGMAAPIPTGRTIIGRSSDCDVVLHNAPADVSRKHLMIECTPQDLRLTDLSSHGTYVLKRALAQQGQTRH